MKKISVTAVALAALVLSACSATKLANDIQVGFGLAKAVICDAAGSGGEAAQRLEVALKKGDAWVETTGEIRAVSAEVCIAAGGSPTALPPR